MSKQIKYDRFIRQLREADKYYREDCKVYLLTCPNCDHIQTETIDKNDVNLNIKCKQCKETYNVKIEGRK